jgi:class 3 adenylate cyclase
MRTELEGSSGSGAAREALDAHRWQDAFDLLSDADRREGLGGADLEALATAAWFAGQADRSLEAKERAFTARLGAGETARAAVLALDVSRDYAARGTFSIAGAWFGRAERLLKDEPESAAHGYLALARAAIARQAGDVDTAIAQGELALDLGMRYGDADLQAWALIRQGDSLISAGRSDEGFRLMEEATVAAINGELDPFTAGVAYCSMIAACRTTTDYRRAGEWTDAARRWCERQAISGFPGVCRVHRAEIEGLQGSLESAERELRTATEELAAYRAGPPMADGFYALGEIRFRMGDLEGARDALKQAHALGRIPHPALALIWLAEGKADAALNAINEAVASQSWDMWTMVRLLPAQVEIAIAAGDTGTARQAAEALEGLLGSADSPTVRASVEEGWGRVLLAEDRPADAAPRLRDAIRAWQDVPAPYETARARVQLAEACRRLGFDEDAMLEYETAQDAFRQLGSVRDEAEVARVLRPEAGVTRVTKTFVFTDIVNSTNLAEAMGDAAWEQVLSWHNDALRSVFAAHGGEVVNSTGDGFFAAFDAPGDAMDAAVEIQRALVEHRTSQGFAPGVRIGIHAAEANHRSDDYSGLGVHAASRIAALAGTDEIVASVATASAADRRFPLGEVRQVALKGFSDQIDVVAVEWRA